MSEQVRLILSLSLSGSILAAIVYALKPLVRHRLSKSIQYYIWLVVLLRLLLPFSPEESLMNGVFYQGQEPAAVAAGTSEAQQGNTEGSGIGSVIVESAETKAKAGYYNNDTDHARYLKDLFNQYLLYIWLFGAVSVLLVNVAGYLRFSAYMNKTDKPASEEQYKVLKAIYKSGRKVRLVCSSHIATPMLKGILRPCIIIPDEGYREEQLRNILLHELSHMKRLDIAVKWLVMLASAIHWFNPLMYFLGKEINRACELACDELAVKDLDRAGKQSYGETLIAVAAEQKLPMGVLQATMCEEKKDLRNRLKAIMNHSKKSRLAAIVSILLLIGTAVGAIALGASIPAGRTSPPGIYISSEGEKTKEALIGTYSWKFRGGAEESDSDHPMNFKYGRENILDTTAEQQLIVDTQKLKPDRKYDFSLEELTVFKDKRQVKPSLPEPSFMNGCLYLQAPLEQGEYVYCLVLDYGETGKASYGFVVRVDMPVYELTEISKCKTPYVGDHTKAMGIAGLLPSPDRDFTQQYISIVTSSKPYKLTMYYEVKQMDTNRTRWKIEKPDEAVNSILEKNALVTFCMIGNLDEITFAFRKSKSEGSLDESKYDTMYTYKRTLIESKYGDITALGNDLGQLEKLLWDKQAVK
ncbi:MAG TPA: M56 family metallopeptidase [Negativicutes bacterium]|nr:M56 family metallopeptidase [Negativicutes bacterium]